MRLGLYRVLSIAFAVAALCGTAQAKEKITIGMNVDPSHAAMTYALRNGKVNSDAVDLEVHLLDINALGQAVITKRLDILEVTALSVPNAIAQGLDVKILGNAASVPSGSGHDIWVDKDSPLREPADLKGKTLGTYSLTTGAVTLVRIALSKHYGFNVAVNGGDFVMKPMEIAAMPAALTTGRLDASMLSNVQAYRAEKSGAVRSLISTDAINLELFGASPVSAVFIGYTDRLNAKPDAYRAAMLLLRDSRNYARAHPDEVYGAVAAAEHVDEDYLRVWEDRYQGFPVALLPTDAASLDKLWQWSKELGILPNIIPAASAIWDKAPRE